MASRTQSLEYHGDHRESISGEPPYELDPERRDLYEEWLQYGRPMERKPGSDGRFSDWGKGSVTIRPSTEAEKQQAKKPFRPGKRSRRD